MNIILGTSTGKDQKGRYIINYPSRWTSTVDRNPFYFYPFQLAYASTLLKPLRFQKKCKWLWVRS